MLIGFHHPDPHILNNHNNYLRKEAEESNNLNNSTKLKTYKLNYANNPITLNNYNHILPITLTNPISLTA